MSNLQKAKNLIKKAKLVVFFTGAGIGVESGIPTFRGSKGTYTSSIFQTLGVAVVGMAWGWRWFPNFCFSKYKSYFLDNIVKANPNDAHYAIVDLYKKKREEAKNEVGVMENDVYRGVYVVTTNVDGLHKKAFSSLIEKTTEINGATLNVIGKMSEIHRETLNVMGRISEIHGETLSFRCMSCEAEFHIPKTNKCKKCDGYLRPNVVFFGENVRSGFSDAHLFSCMDKDSVLVIIGHSGQISREFPEMCKRTVPVIEINIDPKPKYSEVGGSHIHLIPYKERTGKLVKGLLSY